jgi:WS/DGAT/MGAT family acyltransferase
MTAGERISNVDNAWLRMDRPHNRMVIHGVMTFDKPHDMRRLARTYEARFAAYPRFHQFPVEEASGSVWVTDENFSVERHLHRVSLPGKVSSAQLKRFIADLIPQPFERDRPWWHVYYVDNYEGGAALVTRIHHCYADGIALIGVLLGMTDDTPNAPMPKLPKAARRKRLPQATRNAVPPLAHLIEPLGDVLDRAIRVSGDVVDKSIDVLREPTHVIDYARVAARVTNDAAALALMPNDSRTRFKGKPGKEKRMAWSAKLPLDEVKAISHALDCSVNDVLLACVAGALRDYLAEKGDATKGVECRAMVPVNLRPPGPAQTLGNYFGLAPLLLPVGIANPLKRVYEVSARMSELKDSFTPTLALGLLGFMGVAPKLVQEQILQLMASKSTAVMTNVPGPQKPLYLAGREIREQMFWVPQSGNIGMGVSILSYNGAVQFGVITDAKLVPDPENLVEEFQAELEKLVLAVLMEPFDEKRPPSLVERALARATARWQRLREVTAPARPPALPALAPVPNTKGERAAKPLRKPRKTARRAPARPASSPARVR